MALRVLVEAVQESDSSPEGPEWRAWAFDFLGCATHGGSEAEALNRMPQAVSRYCEWVGHHGGVVPLSDTVQGLVVVERIAGNEVLFDADCTPASTDEIHRAEALLDWSRQDLQTLLDNVDDRALDWDPPYARYATWARWRSIREILGHVAMCETRYYLPWIGHDPGDVPQGTCGAASGSREWYRGIAQDWRGLLNRTRLEATRFLKRLATSSDRARVVRSPEGWSVRKILRRLVWHERLHARSIARILRDYAVASGTE